MDDKFRMKREFELKEGLYFVHGYYLSGWRENDIKELYRDQMILMQKAEADVIAAKKKYDQATANLKELLDKRDAIRKEEILSAVVKSGRSYEEIMNFLNAGPDGEKTEK